MTTCLATRSRAPLRWRPLGAVGSTLAAVMFFVLALGPFFLPHELANVMGEPLVNITDCHVAADGRQAILLSWLQEIGRRKGVRRQIAVHQLDGGQSPRILLGGAIEPSRMSVSSDGKRLFAGVFDGSWYVIDLPSAGNHPKVAGRHPEGQLADLACSNDGQTLVTRSEQCMCVWNVANQSIRWRRNDLRAACWDIHPSGRSLVCSTSEGELLEIDLATGRTIRQVRHCRAILRTATISPCGSYIATTNWDGTLTLVDYQTGHSLWPTRRQCTGMAGMSRIAAFSPCCRYLVTMHERDLQTLVVWSVADGRLLGELRGHQGVVVGAAFHKSGTLYSWGNDGSLRAWDLLESGSASRAAGFVEKGLPLAAASVGRNLAAND